MSGSAAEERRVRSWENRLADALPVSPLLIGGIVATLFFASFLLVALLSGNAVIVERGGDITLSRNAWAALAMSLLWCAILGIGRYTVRGNIADARSLVGIVPHITAARVEAFASGVSASDIFRSRLFGWFGFVFAALLHAVGILGFAQQGWRIFENPVDVWMCAMVALLGMQLFRRLYFVRGDTGLFAEALKGIEFDLADMQRLDAFGRVALRGALPWFVVGGILLLLLVGQGADSVTIPALAMTLAVGLFVFARPMLRAHRVIRAAKRRELLHLRGEIARREKALMAEDDVARDAALMLPALVALESRVDRLREWPLDLQTAGRLVLYAAIPLGSWAGAGLVNIALEQVLG